MHYGHITGYKIERGLLGQGQIGMTFFFVLSGYIMSYVYKCFNDGGIKNYYTNRIARINPTYIVYGLIGLPFFVISVDANLSIFSDCRYGDFTKYTQIFFGIIAFVLMIQAWFLNLFNIWNFAFIITSIIAVSVYLIFENRGRKCLKNKFADITCANSRLQSDSAPLALLALPLSLPIPVVGILGLLKHSYEMEFQSVSR
jgi:peptidoglycan/LPS O-acetylase OafA/YrhL